MDIKNSMLLANMMSNSGGTKTLNLVSVDGATYDSDYIFEKTSGTAYFETKDTIDLNTSSSFDFKIKIMPLNNDASNGFYKRETDFYFSGFRASSNQFAFISNTYRINANSTLLNNWYWLRIIKDANSTTFKCCWSWNGAIPDVDYVVLGTFEIATTITPEKIIFGRGTSQSSSYWMTGKIDFKETDIIINGRSVLWV